MTWKVINISNPGTSIKHGGDDLDKVSKLFNGISSVDSVNINSTWTFTTPHKDENYIDLKAIAEPSSPASGYIRYFVDSADGKFKFKRSDGSVVTIE